MMHFNPTLRFLHRAACRLLLFAWVAFAPAMTEAQAAAPSLEIASSGSRVSITPSDASFSERELQAIRSRIEARLRESPLRDKADVRVTLRGDTVRELQARLRRAGPSNAGEIDAFLDQSVERAGSEELTPPIEFSIGRDFTLAGVPMPGSLVAIGSTGTIDGPISDLILIGSSARLGPRADVRDRLLTLGSRLERELVRFAPVFCARTSVRVRAHPWSGLGSGLLLYLAIVPGALLLVLSVLGIALLPLYFALLFAVLWAGYVVSAVVIGELAARSQRGWVQLAIGLAILGGVSFIPVMGGLAVFAAMTAGSGAVAQTLLSALRTRRRKSKASKAAAVGGPAPSGALQM